MITFGQRLKELREKADISQEELGKRFNLSQSTIAYYEKNKKQPSQNTLNKIADFFEVTTDYLLGRTNKPHMLLSPEQSDYMGKLNLDDDELLKRPVYRHGRELSEDEKRRLIRLLRAAVDPDQQ